MEQYYVLYYQVTMKSNNYEYDFMHNEMYYFQQLNRLTHDGIHILKNEKDNLSTCTEEIKLNYFFFNFEKDLLVIDGVFHKNFDQEFKKLYSNVTECIKLENRGIQQTKNAKNKMGCSEDTIMKNWK